MQTLRHETVPQLTLGQLVAHSCETCVHDAGFQSGMAGAARCKLIEQFLAHLDAALSFPNEWELAPSGAVSCTAFCPDFDC